MSLKIQIAGQIKVACLHIDLITGTIIEYILDTMKRMTGFHLTIPTKANFLMWAKISK
jgi:hypothetical protein